jgi:Ser/Thr protein kinase RdoA (MazF antagonist)
LSDAADIIRVLSSEYGFVARDCVLISTSQNRLFRAKSADGEIIVRVTSPSHRTRSELESELRFVEHVINAGVLSAASLPSLSGSRVVLLDDSTEPEFVVAFVPASGREVQVSDLTGRLFTAMGELCARLHTLAVTTEMDIQRQPWFRSRYITRDVDEYLPGDDAFVRDRAHELMAFLRSECDPSDAFPIHADIHFRNLFISPNGLELIDFDNCELGHECLDFGAVLYDCAYSRVRAVPRSNLSVEAATEFSATLWTHFVAGYSSLRKFPEIRIDQLEAAVRLREIIRYTYYHRLYRSMSGDLKAGLAEMREQIRRDMPPLHVRDVLS